MKVPKIIVAGTHSGVGKTSVSLSIMAALKNRGLRVQAFKVGPDYIDSGYHTVATGIPSHNLDGWMMGEEEVCRLYEQNSKDKDIAVIEGVMGLFDGFSSTDDQGSTVQIAKLLNAPIILVIDAGKMARSVSAMIKGYQVLDPEINICGVILNRVASVNHLEMLKESIEHYNAIPVLGSLKKDESIAIPERHLGLMTASENSELRQCLDQLIKHTTAEGKSLKIDLNKILNAAKKNYQDMTVVVETITEFQKLFDVRIAYAKDKAFQFYYQANLDYLESLGVSLIPFSPLEDVRLPENIDGLYFGGGFPEVYAQELEENNSMKDSIRIAIDGGMPTYAECGGLIYLTEKIATLENKTFKMVGVIPGTITMTKRLQNFGYCENTLLNDCVWGKKGETFRGHEFHYSSWSNEGQQAAYQVDKKRKKTSRREGYCGKNILASYVHCHFSSNPQRARCFVQESQKFFNEKQRSNTYA